jgi:hypothetical protein
MSLPEIVYMAQSGYATQDEGVSAGRALIRRAHTKGLLAAAKPVQTLTAQESAKRKSQTLQRDAV